MRCSNECTEQLDENLEKSKKIDLKLLDPILDKYAKTRGSLIVILQKAQDIYGYLPLEVLRYVASKTGVKPATIYGVVTFYTQFTMTPKGEHKIGLCMGTACYVKGAEAILAKVKQELGVEVNGTSADGKFTLEATRCLGACGLAPVMMIDEEVYGRLTPDRVPGILKKYS